MTVGKLAAAGEFDRLIGLREDLYLEAKGRNPYDFSTPQDRYELAKDVSAFANAEGGWVLIGLNHRKLEDEAVDEICGLEMLPSSEFMASQYVGLITEHVYPKIEDLSVQWVEHSGHPGLGIGVIRVPPQKEDVKPFVITKVVEEGSAVKQIVFGYARRTGSDSLPLTVAQIQRAMKQGMNTMAQRLTSIESKLDGLLEMHSHSEGADAPPVSDALEKLHRRIQMMLER